MVDMSMWACHIFQTRSDYPLTLGHLLSVGAKGGDFLLEGEGKII